MKLWRYGQTWELHARCDCAESGHPHFDRSAALLWLWPYKTDARVMGSLRALLWQIDGGSRQSLIENDQVIDRIAGHLDHGWLCLAPEKTEASRVTSPGGGVSSEGAAPPPSSEPTRVPRTSRQPSSTGLAPDAPTFSTDIDAAQIAAAMREAAQLGVPFCEECAKARLRQQSNQPVGAGA